MQLEEIVWEMIINTGWTYEYIDALTMERFREYLDVREGRNKAGIKFGR